MKHLEVLIFSIVLCGCASQRMVMPEFVKSGDKVAVVAPAYAMADSVLAAACDRIREAGLEPVVGKHVGCRFPSGEASSCYAGTPAERAADLKEALSDPEIKAIICTRGGYGSIQTLQEMDLRDFRSSPKWLVGYSDITALHLASVKAGVMSIHGNMCSSTEPEGNRAMLDLLMGKIPEYDIPSNIYNVKGKAEGKLVGGNMITFLTLTNTDYDCFAKGGCILFIEEVEESQHAIDRLFNMLILQNRLKNVKGIVFGEFTDCGTELGYGSVEEMLSHYTSKLGIPVCYGFPAGHGDLNLPLIEGATVSIDVRDDGATIKFKH